MIQNTVRERVKAEHFENKRTNGSLGGIDKYASCPSQGQATIQRTTHNRGCGLEHLGPKPGM